MKGSTIPLHAGLGQPVAARTHPRLHGARDLQCVVFDWEGVQYYYQPDLGTWAKPLPLNSITGLPYLCVQNGALLECAYFCATYAQRHPGQKAARTAA